MRWLFVVMLAGCWSTPRPTGPPVLLRRQHAVGDVLRMCERGDGLLFTPTMDPIVMTTRSIRDERLLAVKSRRFELRTDHVSGSVRMDVKDHAPTFVSLGAGEGTPYEIDDRNQRLDVTVTPPKPVDTDNVNVSASAYIPDIVGMTYPERAVRKHETFPFRVRRTVDKTDSLPTKLTIDLTFVVTKVEPGAVELECKGKQIESARRGKESAIAELELACRVRIDRRNGRSARWWIDSNGDYKQSGNKYPLRARMHYDVTVGDVESEVCDRAKEP